MIKLLEQAPSYGYVGNCTYSATAMLIGYYDLRGYDNLFTASGWEEIRWTRNVKLEIWDSDAEKNSIGDYDNVGYNYPWMVSDWAEYKGYLGWEEYSLNGDAPNAFELAKGYIDKDMPVLMTIQYPGHTNYHAVEMIGYSDTQYACYNTYNEGEFPIWYDTSNVIKYHFITPGGMDNVYIPEPDPVFEKVGEITTAGFKAVSGYEDGAFTFSYDEYIEIQDINLLAGETITAQDLFDAIDPDNDHSDLWVRFQDRSWGEDTGRFTTQNFFGYTPILSYEQLAELDFINGIAGQVQNIEVQFFDSTDFMHYSNAHYNPDVVESFYLFDINSVELIGVEQIEDSLTV